MNPPINILGTENTRATHILNYCGPYVNLDEHQNEQLLQQPLQELRVVGQSF